MTYRKKLIEVALPLEAINKESAREKSIRHGHPSTLHLWWARRPLAACRAVLFASLVDDPSSLPEKFPTEEQQDAERQRLFKIIEELVKWENINNESVLGRAKDEIMKSTDGNPPPVLDPFCGGGSIPLEAQRLGLEAHGSDLNPVAVLITKALIEIPSKFAGKPPVNPEASADGIPGEKLKGAAGLAADVRYYGQWMRDEAEKRIGHLYPKVKLPADQGGGEATVIAWLWARTVTCSNPACGAEMPLASSYWLSKKKGKKAWVRPVVESGRSLTFQVAKGEGEPPPAPKLGRGGKFRCVFCDQVAEESYVKEQGKQGAIGSKLMAIVAEGSRGRSYVAPSAEHEFAVEAPECDWLAAKMPKNPRWFSPPGYGFETYRDLFTSRQLVALTTFSDLVKEAREKVIADARAAGFDDGGGPLPSPPPPGEGEDRAPGSAEDKFGTSPRPSSQRSSYKSGPTANSSPQRAPDNGGPTANSSPQRGEARRGENSKAEDWQPTPVPPDLLKSARALRKNMTDAEQLLWQCLRRKQLDGFRFRKQHPLDHYVLDFYCPARRLAIELDGGQHNTEAAKERDGLRSAYLRRQGIRVLRFWNRQVFEELEGVLTRIWDVLHECGPLPSPPPPGEGEDRAPGSAEDRFGTSPRPSSQRSSYKSGPTASSSPKRHPDNERPLPSPPPPGEGEDRAPGSAEDKFGISPRPSTYNAGPTANSSPQRGEARRGENSGTNRTKESKHLGIDDGGTGATAYGDAVATYLAFAVNRTTNTLCTIARWTPKRDQTVTAFARQALPMTWDYPEVNPFAGAAGDMFVSADSIAKSLCKVRSDAFGQVRQLDATASIDGLNDPVVATDPPYYDNIGYADLSDYFYVWLRRSLAKVFPLQFSTLLTPKDQELIATPYRHGGDQTKAKQFFETGLASAFAKMHEKQNRDYPLTLFYAFKQSEIAVTGEQASTGWETMLQGLLASGFSISGTWPMRSEMSNRMVASGTNALASSIVLSCRPREEDAGMTTRRDFLAELKHELPSALRALQQGNVAPVDLAQASIGPGMAIFSRYSKVIEADGKPMTVRTALALINQALDEVLAEQEGDLDADTRWALAWFGEVSMNAGEYGRAETLCTAKNTAVNALVEAGIVKAGGGKVRLLRREELGPDWDPTTDKHLTVWEVTQHLIRTLHDQGEAAAGTLAARVGGLAESARDLAYRLYVICDKKGWAQEALAYNSLVTAWPQIMKQAGTASPDEQSDIFGKVE